MTVSNTTLPALFEIEVPQPESTPQVETLLEVNNRGSVERQPDNERLTLSASGSVDALDLARVYPTIAVPEPSGTLSALVFPESGNTGASAEPANSELATSASFRAEGGEEIRLSLLNVINEGLSEAASSRGVAPAQIKPQAKHWILKANKKAWSTTFWPFAAMEQQDTVGRTNRNLWAKNGCLDKFDQLLVKRGLPSGARDHELVPALNFLKNDGTPSGYYVPGRWIREDNAEITTGVDFNGNGQLDNLAQVDFLDDNQMFGQNGRTNGILDVGWWGSCDKVALAGLLFEEPTWDVMIDGIMFTRQDIKGLLTVIAGSQASEFEYTGSRFTGSPDRVVLADGTVHFGRASSVTMTDCLKSEFERVNGNRVRVKRLVSSEAEIPFETTGGKLVLLAVSDIVLLEREDKAEPSASDFHQTVKRWLRDERPFAMDRDPGEHIWNVNVDEAEIWKNRKKPAIAMPSEVVGFNGPKGDGDLCYYKTTVKSSSFRADYYYWIEKRDGEHVNSGWLMSNPAFLWRPVVSEPAFEGVNERNPFVDPLIVKEIHRKSTLAGVEYVKDLVSEFTGWMGFRLFGE